ncbi:RodZ domain-containing protein [Alloalcanivorax gelatiniphagus]|uniref:Helix-turn-helix domain-containing protein n=2 Tax=Alloalcanivorax gelatiniphagus TaxID=1194167 RepID=A0ABY2XJG1_9GAMM|nr:RodZ family helix-turn-helix domain-containing protein [Alloalcanivorax gelatiniphagus]TMW12105.1 helix-turn-helix domain-containing protein [Alloalcanivorax gelatiniphagus]|tara:strand:+ start:3315 stop:4241 length:927 start_codon:yes stop_codon:yes gene_type:complete
MSEDDAAMLPGERLRRAREEQGLSQEEVSKQLRLSLSYLKALEDDDYSRLPEPTFIKGYLRNYARLMGLPTEELARRFQQEMDSQRDAEHEREQQAAEHAPRRHEWRVPLVVILVVVLAVAVGWWLWPRGEVAPAPVDSPSDLSPRSEQLGDPAPDNPDPALPDDTEPMAPADESMAPSADEGAGPASGADNPAAPEAGQPAGAPRTPARDGGESAVADAAGNTPAATENDSLSLSFSRLCWVRVVDATGATLSQGQRNAGDRLDLQGQAPFRLTVGDAAAVSSVSLNGEAVSLPSQRSGDVVRVTLP